MFSKLIFLVFCSSLVNSSNDFLGKIDPDLLKSFESRMNHRENVMISMTNGDTGPVLDSLNFSENTTKAERSEGVYQALNAHAILSQSSTLEFLSSATPFTGFSFQSSWISNRIYVDGANEGLVRSLASLPEVDRVRKTPEVRAIDHVEFQKVSEIETKQSSYWGVEKIKAPQVWEMGIRGDGIRVLIIDSGLNVEHKDLKDNYVGNENGWLDAVNGRESAYDDHGHGSHCAGSILRKNGMGVAPNARMMGCKSLSDSGSGSIKNMESCAEWSLKPSGDANNAPHIVSNSWGGSTGTYFDASINAWRAAGIIPIFSAGNSGSRCDTMGYPGSNINVIAVGATDNEDGLASFSSRGPGPNARRGSNKPDVSGPGVNIISASHEGDGTARMSGTSMSCPHVAGLVALMLQKNPNLDYAGIKGALEKNTNQKVKSTGARCGSRRNSRTDSQWPNWHFGYGIVDAQKTITNI